MACRTCDMIRGLLMSRGVPEPVIDMAVAPVAQVEQQVVKKAKKKVSKISAELRQEPKPRIS